MREVLRRLKYYAATLLFVLTSSALSMGSVYAGNGNTSNPPANNGTLKVHKIGTPSGTESENPKVCAFNLEGFGFDASQSGYINIDGQGQTTTNYDGQYPFGPTDANGYAITQDFNNGSGTVTIADGQYKATLYGKDLNGNIDLTDVKATSKVFKVDCGVNPVTPGLDTQVSSGSVYVGDSVADTATFTPTQANGDVTGTVDFYVCGPEQTTPDCTTGGTLVSAGATISNNSALSGAFVPQQPGNYCFRAEYIPDGYADYLPTTHTNTTTECFTATTPTGTVTVTKVVQNNHGGTAVASDFPLYVNGTLVTTGTTNVFTAGQSYTVSENGGPSGYQQIGLVCTDGTTTWTSMPFTLTANEGVSCTITNQDIAPQLTVIKKVVNQYGGTADASDFTMHVTGANVSSSSFAGSSTGTTVTLNAGSYAVTESGGPSNYIGSYSGDCSGTIAIGDTKTCTITNSDTPASISGTKYEVNANGTQVGTTGLSGWTIGLYDSSNNLLESTITDSNGNYSFTNLLGGSSYFLKEVLQTGWTQIYGPQSAVIPTMGQTTPKENFGNFENATVKGYKWNDVNGNGTHDKGEVKLAGWTIDLTDGAGKTVSVTTDSKGNYSFTNVAPGTYKLCEVPQKGWTQTHPATKDGCYDLNVAKSGHTYYRDFGNQGHGTITVTKYLFPASDSGVFNLEVDGQTKATNVGNKGTTGAVDVVAGAHNVSELAGTGTTLSAYDSHYDCFESNGDWVASGDTTTSSDFNVSPGETVNCAFENFRHASLTIVKKAYPFGTSQRFTFDIASVNEEEEGSPLTTSTTIKTFQLDDNNDLTLSNTDTSSLSSGRYTVTEESTAGWNLVGIDCGGAAVTISGATLTIDLDFGQQVTCTYTNQQPTVPQVLGASTGFGGGRVLGASTLANTGTSTVLPTILAISMALTATGIMLGDYMRRKSAVSDPTL